MSESKRESERPSCSRSPSCSLAYYIEVDAIMALCYIRLD